MKNILFQEAGRLSLARVSFHPLKKKLPLIAAGFVFLIMGCTEPVPLYGKWADNKGNTISFFDDGKFVAAITDSSGSGKIYYDGSYSVLLNALTFNGSDFTVVTEWDIRGNMLYIDWTTDSGGAIPLTLYKISN
jgi:hypothetical protein